MVFLIRALGMTQLFQAWGGGGCGDGSGDGGGRASRPHLLGVPALERSSSSLARWPRCPGHFLSF